VHLPTHAWQKGALRVGAQFTKERHDCRQGLLVLRC
jgi:hypothetical protein